MIGFVRHLIFIPVCLLLIPVGIFAAGSDTFTVTQSVNTVDNDPPTIPGNFSVAPVATTQIDLDWDASSDNIGVAGYRVFRDAVFIATTTQSAYSDTGLIANTAYNYNVIAFDVALNFSTSTAVLSTTTLAEPIVPPAVENDNGISGYYLDEINISNEVVRTSERSISLSFDSSLYLQTTIRWGRTASYELGYIASEVYKKSHQALIEDLEPGVLYEVAIKLTDRYGRSKTVTRLVRTQSQSDDQSPLNVSGLRATLTGDAVELFWQNPAIADFSRVRVLSSDYFYPGHPADGWFIYEGTAQAATDDRSIAPGQTRYYSVFVFDEVGNISSGAVVALTRSADGTQTVPTAPPPVGTSTTDGINITFNTIEFVQDDVVMQAIDSPVSLDGTAETVIRIPYEALPERLKTIIVTFTDPDDEQLVFSFLLKVNQEATYFEARLGAFKRAGLFPVAVSIFDYKTQTVSVTTGEVSFRYVEPHNASGVISYSSVLVSEAAPFVGTILAALLLLLLILLLRRRAQE